MAGRRTGTARSQRRRQGPAARAVWSALRGGRCGGFKFRREHPIGPHCADIACRDLRLVIELDGGVDDLPEVQLAGLERQQALEALGWTVIRFRTGKGLAVKHVIDAVRAHASSLQLWPISDVARPTPLPTGEGGARGDAVGG